MADFNIAYKIIERNEGGYANTKGDRGGETCYGIARNFHPKWGGWKYIDEQKNHPLFLAKKYKQFTKEVLDKIPELQTEKIEFFKSWFKRNNYNLISSQEVANRIFDMSVNIGEGIDYWVQKIVGVVQDGNFGPKTLNAINLFDQNKLIELLKKRAFLHYENIVKADPSQAKFLNTWKNRWA